MNQETMADNALFLFKKKRMNCAEAVGEAWQKAAGKDLDVMVSLSECGSGHAPMGLCGAVYAAQLASDGNQRAELNRRFADAAGSLLCREIRSMRKLSCAACVELAASLLDENLQPALA
ncbi:MAG: hypothetical protein R2864_13250 [Syntrophotaleaceae bacterium]